VSESRVHYTAVDLEFDRAKRTATLTVSGPEMPLPSSLDEILAAGDRYWPLRAFRELDDALLRLRMNEPLIGTIVLKTRGDQAAMRATDAQLIAHQEHWFVRETMHFIKRTLKRLDLTSRSFFALIEPGSCFVGTLFELALAADRSYMLDDPEQENTIGLSPMNSGPLKMSNGLTRLATRFLAQPSQVEEVLARGEPFSPEEALDAGLVSFTPDELDWDDEVRLAIESRAALSPDALTGMEANLRFAGPETMETKIFGRLTAWQNWIFIRPNAVGEKGALTAYGSQSRPEFDFKRT
jgi:benzoyl-CoA-dihydrodiol lyase